MAPATHDPTLPVSLLQQCLSGGKKPIGLFLGAGCPMAVPRTDNDPLIPDIPGITRLVREQMVSPGPLKHPFEIAFAQLTADGNQAPTVEDLLTHIRALAAVAGNDRVRGLTAEQLGELDTAICGFIHQVVNQTLPNEETPFHRLATWTNAIPREFPVELFTTNYDLLIEQALEERRVPYFDGFSGARRPLFDPSAVEQAAPLPHWTRLWKLHGSINWYQDENLDVFRGTATESGKRRVIHPSHLKYRESRRMPYLAMLDRLRSFLRIQTAALITCGYSFRDEHINETILQGLQHTHTTVVFALMFTNISECEQATTLAEQRPSLNVLARDGGIIAGQFAEWESRNREAISVWDDASVRWIPADQPEPEDMVKAEFMLGDFQNFSSFLQQLAGDGP